MKKILVSVMLAGLLIWPGASSAQALNTLSVSQLQAILASLQAQLNALIAQLNQLQQQENNSKCLGLNQEGGAGSPSCCSGLTRQNLSSSGTTYKCVKPIVKPIENIKPSIRVTSPNGGESYVSGRDEIIAKWSGYNLNGDAHYRIALYSPTLGDVHSYDYPTQGGFLNRSYSFYVPRAVLAGEYKINVCALNTERPDAPGKNVCDLSDNYFKITSGTSVNKPPVIASIGGPENNSLKVGEAGYWSVSAYDPDGNEPITYKVNCGNDTWGARMEGEAGPHLSCVYKNPGIYNLEFVVTDTKGLSTEADRQVTVTSPTTPSRAGTINVKVLKGGIYCIKAPCEFPLAGATVALYDQNKVLVGNQVVGADGFATFTGLNPGTYTAISRATGYVNTTNTIGVLAGQSVSIKTILMISPAPTSQLKASSELASVLQSLQRVLGTLSPALGH